MVIFEVKVLKRGRKWFEVQETKEWVSGKMLIDSKTDLITVGEAYNILGKKEKNKNNYGTTIIYTCEKILENDEVDIVRNQISIEKKTNNIINELDRYDNKITSYNYPITMNSTIYKNLKLSIKNSIDFIKNNKSDELGISINKTIKILTKNTDSISVLEDLLQFESIINNKNKEIIEHKISILKEKINEENNFKEIQNYNYMVAQQLKNIENLYDKEIYTELIEYKDIMNKENMYNYYKLKDIENNFDKELSFNVIENIFKKRNKEEFHKYIDNILKNRNSNIDIDKIFEKYSYRGNIFMLNYRINDKNTFIEIMKQEYMVDQQLDYGKKIYIVKNPFRVFDILVKNDLIKVKNNMNDEEIIKLWGRSIGNEFTFRKEYIENEVYYLVKEKKKNSEWNNEEYFAYYILGCNSDNKIGFEHRIPWREEGKYENISIKEILDEIFGYKFGFKRVKADIVAREISFYENIKRTETTIFKYVFKTKNESFDITKGRHIKNFLNNVLIDENIEYKKFENDQDVELRKDLILESSKIFNLIYDNIIIVENPIIKYKDKEILNLKGKTICIYKEKKENSTKIKFNFYYDEIIDIGEIIEEQPLSVYKNIIIESNGKEDFDSNELKRIYKFAMPTDKHNNYFIAKVGKNDKYVVSAKDYNSKVKAFEGPIVLEGLQGDRIIFGEKGKYYQIGSAIRHRSELNVYR